MKKKKPAGARPKQPPRRSVTSLAQRPQALRRDTPVDTPAIVMAPPPGVAEADRATRAASELLKRLETIEAAYEAWDELREEQSQLRERLREEHQRLEEQGDFLVGAVKKARDLVDPGSAALAKTGDGLDGFVAQASGKLDDAKAELKAREAEIEKRLEHGLNRVKAEVRARLERSLAHFKPKLKLMVRTLANGRRIVHLGRPAHEEAPLMLFALSGRVPTRYGFLFDDSTDDPARSPPTLYADEGVKQGEVRPAAGALAALIDARKDVLPVKGIIPLALPRASGSPLLVRFVERGPVMEAELAEGEQWRNLLTTEEAEELAGWLLKLKLEGKVELELARG